METDNKYFIGKRVEDILEDPKTYDSYGSAYRAKENIEETLGMRFKIFKVEVKVTEVDNVSEDYWPHG